MEWGKIGHLRTLWTLSRLYGPKIALCKEKQCFCAFIQGAPTSFGSKAFSKNLNVLRNWNFEIFLQIEGISALLRMLTNFHEFFIFWSYAKIPSNWRDISTWMKINFQDFFRLWGFQSKTSLDTLYCLDTLDKMYWWWISTNRARLAFLLHWHK